MSLMRALAPIVLLLLVLAAAPTQPAAASGCSASASDCIEDALEWFATPESYSNVGATLEPGEPTCGSMHNTVWLKLEVQAPGASDLFAVGVSASFFATPCIPAATREAGRRKAAAERT